MIKKTNIRVTIDMPKVDHKKLKVLTVLSDIDYIKSLELTLIGWNSVYDEEDYKDL